MVAKICFTLFALCLPWLGCARPVSEKLSPKEQQRKLELEQHAELNPKHGTELGRLYLKAGKIFVAADTLLAAARAGDDSADVHGGLARAYIKLGYFVPAVDRVKRCFRASAQHPDCLFVSAQILEQEGSSFAEAQALKAYRRLVDMGIQSMDDIVLQHRVEDLNIRAEFRKNATPDRADFSPPSNTGSSAPSASAPSDLNDYGKRLAEALRAQAKQDWAGAMSAYRAALELRPRAALAESGLSLVLFESGDLKAATEQIEKSLQAHPDDLQVLYVYGRVMRAQKRTKDAHAAWQKIWTKDPEYAKAMALPSSETLR